MKKVVFTIARQYGSGGKTVGKMFTYPILQLGARYPFMIIIPIPYTMQRIST